MTGIKAWHGSQRWTGWPELRPCKKGQYECGPGIYCTTNLNTARRYSKGAGRIVEFTLSPDIRFLEDIKIPHEEALAFVKQSHHIRKKPALTKDLIQVFDRRESVRSSGLMPLSYLVNLAVNNESLSGLGGPELAEYLVSKGAQASLYHKSSDDDWVILFDLKALLAHEPKEAGNIDWTRDQLAPVKEQLAILSAISASPTPAY